MQLTRPMPARGATVGLALELLGLSVAVFGLNLQSGTGGGGTVQGNPIVSGLGVLVVVVGLLMHAARV